MPTISNFNSEKITESVRVLVLCTGNSCRSIMAEALINALGQGHYLAQSAGSHPTGRVHPLAIATLRRHGIEHGHLKSQSWHNMTNTSFDLVITVCDQAAKETCPIFPGQPLQLHWSIPDPASATGTEEDNQIAFDQAFFLIKSHIEKLLRR